MQAKRQPSIMSPLCAGAALRTAFGVQRKRPRQNVRQNRPRPTSWPQGRRPHTAVLLFWPFSSARFYSLFNLYQSLMRLSRERTSSLVGWRILSLRYGRIARSLMALQLRGRMFKGVMKLSGGIRPKRAG